MMVTMTVKKLKMYLKEPKKFVKRILRITGHIRNKILHKDAIKPQDFK